MVSFAVGRLVLVEVDRQRGPVVGQVADGHGDVIGGAHVAGDFNLTIDDVHAGLTGSADFVRVVGDPVSGLDSQRLLMRLARSPRVVVAVTVKLSDGNVVPPLCGVKLRTSPDLIPMLVPGSSKFVKSVAATAFA